MNGWICSRCGRSNAPWLEFCGCKQSDSVQDWGATPLVTLNPDEAILAEAEAKADQPEEDEQPSGDLFGETNPKQSFGERFGERLRQFRKDAHLTPEELGPKSNVHPQVIRKLESGERRHPRWDVAVRLADGLGVSLDEFRG